MDSWEIVGTEFANCNCDWGCPCQFGAPTTHGRCQALSVGTIEQGHFNEVKLDGLNFAMVLSWPGEIADGDGTQRIIIDERADADQFEALRKILHGESTEPGATHFFVFNSTMSTVLDPVAKPLEVSIDVDARTGSAKCPGLFEMSGAPIIDAFSGDPVRSGISLPNGFEYTYAEMGNASSSVTDEVAFELSDSYGQFNKLHMTQSGVVR